VHKLALMKHYRDVLQILPR